MHGNVWEGSADWYAAGYYADSPEHDPRGRRRGTWRVLRGGSWNNSGHLCRAARRNKYAPDFRNDAIGFRVVSADDRSVTSPRERAASHRPSGSGPSPCPGGGPPPASPPIHSSARFRGAFSSDSAWQ